MRYSSSKASTIISFMWHSFTVGCKQLIYNSRTSAFTMPHTKTAVGFANWNMSPSLYVVRFVQYSHCSKYDLIVYINYYYITRDVVKNILHVQLVLDLMSGPYKFKTWLCRRKGKMYTSRLWISVRFLFVLNGNSNNCTVNKSAFIPIL